MDVTHFLSLLGGLALFLYGMQMMSTGLEAAAGNRMKQILEKLTANRFLGVAVGAGITAVIQSSSATTVMVVGFVNSGMMTLRQAVWIIMGANIGTTITGQLIALDVGAMAPLFAFVGVAMVVFLKKAVFHHYGQIIAGLGILFLGMEMMSSSMLPLRESEAFIGLMTRFSNPLLGILAGALFTAIIQSSSASVGILQALAGSGLIGLSSAVYVLFGQNIGTCITAVQASIGTSRNAKRTTIIHLLFNIIGTILFTTICMLFPLTDLVESITPSNPAAQIANMHTLFNITTTVLLLPLGNQLAAIATRILPERPYEDDQTQKLLYIKPQEALPDSKMGNSAIAINDLRQELSRMADMVQRNVDESFLAVLVTKYISRVITYENNPHDSALISAYLKISGDLERIGDHAINICQYTQILESRQLSFSDGARQEITQMHQISLKALSLVKNIDSVSLDALTQVSALEQRIDDMTLDFRQHQLDRLQNGTCSGETCILYSEMLTDFERIGDHILNICRTLSSACQL